MKTWQNSNLTLTIVLEPSILTLMLSPRSLENNADRIMISLMDLSHLELIQCRILKRVLTVYLWW